MKLTLAWLKDHLETDADLRTLTTAMTDLGLEVDSVHDRAAAFAPFKVAFVESAVQHPDADRLRVLMVDTGTEKLQVVCGAPNARAGMKGVFAPEGSFIPGTGITLKKGMIRGQESNGMMVSEREMGLSDDHEGIIDVAGDVPVGTPFASLYRLDDPVIEIGLTPNRPDCAGVRGIARDLAAAGHGELRPLNTTIQPGRFPSPVKVTIADDARDACPIFIGCLIRNVRNGPSPQWLQDRLKAVGLRPISALVDITNYLSLDLCRPLHVFDADKLRGDIQVRLAHKDEELAALNGKTYPLDDFMTVVCDDSGVLGLGGVMGGEGTACTPETTNVFVECAYFDPVCTARTGRALQIDSDARYRFERGIDPAFTPDGMQVAIRLVLDLCGGEASEPVIAGSLPEWRRTIRFDPFQVQRLAGFDIAEARQRTILERLGFTVDASGDIWAVQPPSWRGDVAGAADLVEEIVRVQGLDAIPPVSLMRDSFSTQGAETQRGERSRKARNLLASRGLNECVTWSFMPSAAASLFGSNDNPALVLRNPISADLDRMRPTPLGNLIEAAGRNRDKGFGDLALFEVGPAFCDPSLTGQTTLAAGLRAGSVGTRHWTGPDASRQADLYDVKADVLSVLGACGAPSDTAQVTRDAPPWYHPGRSGTIRLGKNELARFGEIHPQVLEHYGIKGSVMGFEVFLDALPQAKRKSTMKPLLQLAALQPVVRDFAFLVESGVEAESIVRAARAADKALIADVSLFDIYTGKGVEPGRKSVAIAVTLQPKDHTLTDKEIEALCERVVDAVVAKTGGQLRA